MRRILPGGVLRNSSLTHIRILIYIGMHHMGMEGTVVGSTSSSLKSLVSIGRRLLRLFVQMDL